MLVLGSAAFFALGIVLVLVGANQAEMARDLGMDLAASGLLGASLSLGLAVGVVSAGPLVDRLPRRPIFVAACLLTAASLLTAGVEMSYARAVLHVAVIGAGCGIYDTLLNAVTLDRWRERAASPLAALHAAATAGAVAGPPLVAWVTEGATWARSFHALGLAYVVLAAWAALVPLPEPTSAKVRSTLAARADRRDAHPRLVSPALLGLSAAAFAYVGVETALTLFAVPWATDGLALDEAAGRTGISLLWLGLLGGRLALAARRAPPGAALLFACGAAGAATVFAASSFARTEIGLGMLVAGLVLGPVYPVLISLAGRRLPHTTGRAAGLIGGAGALGGFLVPSAAGLLGDAAGVIVAVGALGVACLAIAASAPLLRSPSEDAPRRASPS